METKELCTDLLDVSGISYMACGCDLNLRYLPINVSNSTQMLMVTYSKQSWLCAV